MGKSTHAFADTREATTYTMLRRVLQNHCTTHVMSLLDSADVRRVAVSRQPVCSSARPGVWRRAPSCSRCWRGSNSRCGRGRSVCLSPLEAADDADPHDPRVRDQTEALSRALATLLGDAEEAHHISPEGSWRIACALVADLLCLWLPGDAQGVVVDAVIDQLGRAVAAQIARARGQTAPAPHGRSSAGVREA